VTLLPPLKQITTLNLPKLSIFAAQPQPQIVSDPTPLPPTPSEVLSAIGSQLRQMREQQQLSIDDMSARTQVQPRLIQAIETGHIEILPEPVYVRGMVKRYGDSLGLDGLALSQQVPFWERENRTSERQTVRQNPSFHAPQIKPVHIYVGYTLAIFGIGAGISSLLSDALKPKHSIVGSTAIPKQPATIPTVVARPQTKAPHSVNIAIAVKSPTWAQIGIDGTTKFTGNLKVGTQFNWVGTKQLTISTNNAGGLILSRDRQSPQPLGKIGEKQNITIKLINN
jgi:transcriptional regulator with XRE-family HTH domain